MGRRSIVLAAGVLVAAATSVSGAGLRPAAASSNTRYVITDLGSLGGSFTDAGNLNNRGQVTGIGTSPGDTALRGFLWKDGRMKDVGTLGGTQTFAGAINDSGQFSGWSNLATPAPPSIFNQQSFFCNPPMVSGEPTTVCRAFVAERGKLRDLGTLGGPNSAAENKGINEWGHVAGVAETAKADPTSPYGGPIFHAFLWRGKMLDLGTLGSQPDSIALAVNDLDQVVGSDVDANAQNPVGWLWQAGHKTALGTLGGSFGGPAALNDRGQVVGAASVAGDAAFHAFLWQRGRMTDLGTLPGDTNSETFDINEQGQIVGLSCSASGCRPTLWQGGSPVDLNTLAPSTSGWQLFDANAINERGQIVGGGIHNGSFDAYLMTPVH